MMLYSPPRRLCVFDSMDDVDKTIWTSFAGGNAMLSPQFLRAMESAGLQGQPRYFVGFEHGRPLGIAVGWLRSIQLEGATPPLIRRAVEHARRVAPNFLRLSLLDLGPSASDGTALAAGPDSRNQQTWLRFLLDETSEFADALVVRDFVGPRQRLEEDLQSAGFSMMPALPTLGMHVRWREYSHFLNSLRSKYRSALLASQRRVDRRGVRRVLTSHPVASLQDYERLFANVARKHHGEPATGPQYFRAMAQHARENSLWLQYFLGSKLIAFVHCLRAGDELWSMFLGMDYDECLPIRLYFETYYDQIRYAIETGVRYVHFGSGAYTAKTDVGCSVFPQRTYFRHRSAWQQRLLTGMQRMMWRMPTMHLHRAFQSRANQYLWPGEDMFMTDAGDYAFGALPAQGPFRRPTVATSADEALELESLGIPN